MVIKKFEELFADVCLDMLREWRIEPYNFPFSVFCLILASVGMMSMVVFELKIHTQRWPMLLGTLG